jgi:glycosyltransferase involved in cell wall biosynthesis
MEEITVRDSTAPTFSVMICTYNRAELLPRAMDSVLSQHHPDFELVVVDDGSTDATPDVVRRYSDPRVRYVHQENQGLGAARNAGVAHSTGRYVLFLDDDDLALPRWLHEFAGAIDGEPAVVSCGEVLEADDGTPVQTRLPGPLGPGFADYSGWFLPGTFAVRRDAFDAVGGFVVGLEHMHQTEFALRLLPACREHGWDVRTIKEALVLRHVGGARRVGRGNTAAIARGMGYVLDRHHDQLARSPALLAQYSAVAGVAAARTGDYRLARRHLWRAARTRPRDPKYWIRLVLASVPPVGHLVWDRHDVRGRSVGAV